MDTQILSWQGWLIANYNYLTAPATIFSIIGCTWFMAGKMTRFETSLDILSKNLDILAKKVEKIEVVLARLNHCMVEVQTFIKTICPGATFAEVIELYGASNSPMVLKSEFKHYIYDTSLDIQIKDKKEKLVEWLKNRHPETGLDAQTFLFELVVSDEINKFIDTKKLKDLLYQEGKTVKDYHGILSIYLFEVIIPEVID